MQITEVIKKIIYYLLDKKQISKRVIATVTKEWQEIDILLKGPSPSQLKQALIVADKSLDAVLKEFSDGSGMAQRLIGCKNYFLPQTYQKIWDAHKIRNALVHESGFEVQHFALKAAVESFRNGMKELGIKV
jgi:hypothetical protein